MQNENLKFFSSIALNSETLHEIFSFKKTLNTLVLRVI